MVNSTTANINDNARPAKPKKIRQQEYDYFF